MPVADWSVAAQINSPFGVLPLNQDWWLGSDEVRFQLVPQACFLGPGVESGTSVRTTKDNVPQDDGSILHRRFLPGYEAQLVVEFWLPKAKRMVACDDVLQSMLDYFMGVTRSLLNAGDNEGRFIWTPDGAATRMLDDIKLLTFPAETIVDGSAGIACAFTIDTALPYAEDLEQSAETFTGTHTITNGGTAPFFPVFKVFGSTSAFTITNHSVLDSLGNALKIEYSGPTIPGGGQYLELNVFNNTAFLNGNQDDDLSGIVFAQSDFFVFVPGDNDLEITGATMQVLYQDAWA